MNSCHGVAEPGGKNTKFMVIPALQKVPIPKSSIDE